jgi:hypothetical protein
MLISPHLRKLDHECEEEEEEEEGIAMISR